MRSGTDLRLLQDKIDEVIGRIGSEGLYNILQIISNPDNTIDQNVFEKKLYLFIVNCVGCYYKLSPKKIILSESSGSRKSSKHSKERQVCYYLIKKHLKFSVRKIAEIFSRDIKNIHEGIKSMEYFIEGERKPDKAILADVLEIDNQILQFKANLKANGKEEKTV